VTAGGTTSAAFAAEAQNYSPAFFTYGHGSYVMGTRAPAAPGDVIVLYGNGFGPISHPVIAGSKAQSGPLPTLPVVTIGGVPAEVHLAGLASPGLYQFNVVVPASAPRGDDPVVATYNGVTTQPGVKIAVQ
jgi:uncharacterized protein (TIGR03437 family)